MEFFITYDADVESGLDRITFGMTKALRDHFADRFYDDSGIAMAIIVMCRDPSWSFKQRIRFVKQENCLYMDLMLDLNEMIRLDGNTKKRIVAQKIITEVPQIVAKRKFRDFDLLRFTSDLREWFETHGWINPDFPDHPENRGEP
jgi:hypothetical protein